MHSADSLRESLYAAATTASSRSELTTAENTVPAGAGITGVSSSTEKSSDTFPAEVKEAATNSDVCKDENMNTAEPLMMISPMHALVKPKAMYAPRRSL